MNILSEKSLIEWISKIEDESIIEDIKMLRENSVNGKDWGMNLVMSKKGLLNVE